MSNRTQTPLRFRDLNESTLLTNEAGGFKFFDREITDRLFTQELTTEDEQNLKDLSILIDPEERWRLYSLVRRVRKNVAKRAEKFFYLIVIPTLRCDLSCSYCQVSRAPVKAKGYDWDDDTVIAFEQFVAEQDLDFVKVEFQGGEPTLRPDLIERIIEICERHSKRAEFVVCSNIVDLNPNTLSLIERPNLTISTSIDGSIDTMTTNRTEDDSVSAQVFKNFKRIVNEFGYEKIAALPTITDTQMDDPETLIDTYADLGFRSIFLRPVNYQGFARKAHGDLSKEMDRWHEFYERAMQHILKLSKKHYFEEYYTAQLVSRVFARQGSGFVDFRSPSWFADEYCVIDYDGKIYPTDESRMLSRINHVDLCIGSLNEGIEQAKVDELNHWAINQVHEDCIHCAYMPFCGIDIVDDMSRYKRFDLTKADTWFCNRQMYLFDFIFSKIQKQERDWLDLFLKWMRKTEVSGNAYEIFQ